MNRQRIPAPPDDGGPAPIILNLLFAELAIEKAGSADRSAISGALRSIANAPGETILPGEFAKAKAILASGGDIHYVGASGPQDFDENGDVAGYFSANVVKDGSWEGTIID